MQTVQHSCELSWRTRSPQSLILAKVAELTTGNPPGVTGRLGILAAPYKSKKAWLSKHGPSKRKMWHMLRFTLSAKGGRKPELSPSGLAIDNYKRSNTLICAVMVFNTYIFCWSSGFVSSKCHNELRTSHWNHMAAGKSNLTNQLPWKPRLSNKQLTFEHAPRTHTPPCWA